MESKRSLSRLALLYNAPRGATIKALKASILFSLDRQTFNSIVKGSSMRHRKRYEELMNSVELFKNVDSYEKLNLCDALESKSFKDGDIIIHQGQFSEFVYFVEEGKAASFKKDSTGEMTFIRSLTRFDSFGERALLSDDSAQDTTIIATGPVTVCLVERETISRLVGSLELPQSHKL